MPGCQRPKQKILITQKKLIPPEMPQTAMNSVCTITLFIMHDTNSIEHILKRLNTNLTLFIVAASTSFIKEGEKKIIS